LSYLQYIQGFTEILVKKLAYVSRGGKTGQINHSCPDIVEQSICNHIEESFFIDIELFIFRREVVTVTGFSWVY